MTTTLHVYGAIELQVQESIERIIPPDVRTTAGSPIATIGSTVGTVLFTQEADAAIPATTSMNI
tara:strand:- start:1322 stop:1513 length:192 start_codon:yes stop_codon:yes gene_type:complete